jgi:hypothetical protein
MWMNIEMRVRNHTRLASVVPGLSTNSWRGNECWRPWALVASFYAQAESSGIGVRVRTYDTHPSSANEISSNVELEPTSRDDARRVGTTRGLRESWRLGAKRRSFPRRRSRSWQRGADDDARLGHDGGECLLIEHDNGMGGNLCGDDVGVILGLARMSSTSFSRATACASATRVLVLSLQPACFLVRRALSSAWAGLGWHTWRVWGGGGVLHRSLE